MTLNNLRKFRSNFWQSYIEQHPDDLELRLNHIDSNVYEEAGGVSISLYIAQQVVGIFLPSGIRNFDSLDRESSRAWKNGDCCCDWCCVNGRPLLRTGLLKPQKASTIAKVIAEGHM